MKHVVHVALTCMALACGPSSGGGRPVASEPGPFRVRYDVDVDLSGAADTANTPLVARRYNAPAAGQFSVRARFSSAPGRVHVIAPGAQAPVTQLRVGGTPTEARSPLPLGDAREYTYDVAPAAMRPLASHSHGATWLSTAYLLWAPRRAPDEVLVCFRGAEVTAAWPRANEPGCFAPDPSVLHFETSIVLGPVRERTVETEAFSLRIVTATDRFPADDAQQTWLQRVGRSMAMLGDRSTAPRGPVTLLMAPAPTGYEYGAAVVLGFAQRGGGSTVLLYTDPDAGPDGYEDDWVLVHELLHLHAPHIRRSSAWLSEGLASYYQEVLRARSGWRTPEQAMNALDQGFARGRDGDSVGTLGEDSAAIRENRAFARVYNGGAALMLMLDVALRRASEGQWTLDDALAAMPPCPPCRISPEADALLDVMDHGLGVTRPLCERVLGATQFPDVEPTYRALGIARTDDGQVRFVDAPDAAIRDAIFAPPAPR